MLPADTAFFSIKQNQLLKQTLAASKPDGSRKVSRRRKRFLFKDMKELKGRFELLGGPDAGVADSFCSC